MKHVLLGLTACVLSLSASAQQFQCGTDRMRAERIAADPTYLQREAEYEAEIQRLIANSSERRDRDVVVTIPIVFHIIHLGGSENISNEQILNQVELLNEDFRALNADLAAVHPAFQDLIGDAEIQFALPTLDPDGNCTNGIDRIRSTETNVGNDGSKLNPWPRDKYLNVWAVNRMGSEGVAGYAYYPSALDGAIGRLADGIILLNGYIGQIGTGQPFRSTALSHEIGHYLNLPHVWGNNNGQEEGTAPPGHMISDCGDDNVEDTPVTRGWNYCPPYDDDDNPWADCNKYPLEDLVYDFNAVTTSSGNTDPTELENAVDSLQGVARVRTVMGSFSATGVSANSVEAEAFAFTAWDQGPVDGELEYAFLPGSINTDKYYSFTVDPGVTDLLTIDSLGFRVKRNANGIRTFAVRSSASNFSTNLPIRTGGNPAITVQAGNVAFYAEDGTTEATIYVDPPANGHRNLDTPLTFRLYAWNAEDANGTARVCLNGTAIDLFDKLGGAPQPGGTWSGPSPTTGDFDPATMLAGDYTYTVDAAAPCDAYTATVTVTLIDPPAVPTISGASSFCAGSNIALTSSSATNNTWSPGGQTTAALSVNKAGSYTVTVKENGCSQTSAPFDVASVAIANAGTNDALTVCDSSTPVPLFNSLAGTPDLGGSWIGPSTVTDGLYDPTTMTAGVYRYVVLGNAPCANDTADVTVSLSAIATAGTNGTITLCSNASPVDLFDRLNAAPQSGGVWDGPSPTSGEFDPATMLEGSYAYTVAPGGACGDSTATVNVNVNDAPALPTISGPTTFCQGSSITLTSSVALGNVWSPGGQITQSIVVNAVGDYSVTATVGSCASTSEPFAVASEQPLDAGKDALLTVCEGSGSVALFTSLDGTPVAGGTWTGPSTVVDGLYDPATMDAGDYIYTVTATAPCTDLSATVTVSESNTLTPVDGTFEVDDVVVYGVSGLIENVENYMEYSYCSKMFSKGQVERMRTALNSVTGERSSTWTEANLQAVGIAEGFQAQCPPIADFYVRTVLVNEPSTQEIPFSPTVCTGETVQFMDNSVGGLPTGWSWTFQDGTPATSTDRNPVVSFSSNGFKNVSLTASNANGSDTKTTDYSILVGGEPNDFTGVYQEGFEDNDGLFPWLGMNYDDNITSWQRTTAAAFSGNACAVLNSGSRNDLDLIDRGNEQDIDELISPTFDLDDMVNAQLSFRYAYSTSTGNLWEVTEKLLISSSTDCGETWVFRAELEDEELINNGNNPQLPPPAWTLKTLTLPASVRAPNVRFRFRYTSSVYSGNLYIDDINISGSVGIEDLSAANFMSLYPNPSNDRFTLTAFGMDRFETEVVVQDLRGAIVHRSLHRPAGQAGLEFSGRELGLSDGLYMIRVANEAGSSTQKLIIGK